jgi:hypothetical protein
MIIRLPATSEFGALARLAAEVIEPELPPR